MSCWVILGLAFGPGASACGRIDEYEDVLGGIKRGFSAFHGMQPEDPVKAGNVIVRVLGEGGSECSRFGLLGGMCFGR